VVLNFWSVWCAPCIPELAGFQELQQRHPGVVVAAIATNSKPEEVRALLEERNLTSLRVALSEETAEAFGGIGVPRTFVLDAQGRIRFVHTGALPDVVVVLEEDLAWLESEEDRSASDK
ncbi:MAG: TlpA family protein disulfide reductase, partial [Terriglobia bacterium]